MSFMQISDIDKFAILNQRINMAIESSREQISPSRLALEREADRQSHWHFLGRAHRSH
jgi:hypothetical protein